MAQRNVFEKRLGLFVSGAICYKYADRAISYLLHQQIEGGPPWGTLHMDIFGCWVGLLCLGLLPFVFEIALLRKLGYHRLWPLPFLAATTLCSFVMLWQRQVDSRIAFAIYFVPVLILLFVRERRAGGPGLTDPK
jgi:hypothetical protein